VAWIPTRTPAPTAQQRGAAAVEFALVLPVFLLLFFGLVFFGVTFTLQHNLTHAAQIGARAGLIADPETLSTEDYEAKMFELARNAAKEVLDWMPEGSIEITPARKTADGADWLEVTVKLSKHPLSGLAGFLSLGEFTELTGHATLQL